MVTARIVLQVALLVLGVSSAWAEAPSVRIVRVSEPPVIDRYLDGKTTPPGVKITGFMQREPGDNVPVSQPTDAYLSYDEKQLYVVFVCKDDPSKIRARLTKREAIGGDEFVGIILDTYHDQRRAYLFITNPLGIQLDGVTTEGQNDDYSFDALWKSDGRLTSDGFVVVMAIPFKSLRFSTAATQTWGFAVARTVVRNNETSFWPYITRKVASFGPQLAVLEGLEGISPGRNLQAIPYGTFAGARFLDERGARTRDNTARFGVDAKAVVKDSVTVDLTVNPDFSQVESDEPQVTVNQRFEVFFPEKRPFFIENASFFDTPERLFFSRRIADPGFGVRVTGKAGRWAFGGVGINDRRPGHAAATDDPQRDKITSIGVGRLQFEVSKQASVGMIVTARDFGSASNVVAGIDTRSRLNANWSLSAQAVASETTSLDGPRQSGTSYSALLTRNGRHLNWSAEYLDRSPGFQAAVGYIPRVDMRQVRQAAGYRWKPDGGRVVSFGPDLGTSAVWDHKGVIQDWSVSPEFSVLVRGPTEVGAGFDRSFERFGGIDFNHQRVSTWASTDWLSWIGMYGHVSAGTGINYYPADGHLPTLGNNLSAEGGVTLRPSPPLRIEQVYLFSRLSTRAPVQTVGGTRDGTIFSNHILRTRVNYQFSRPLSLRAIVDYDSVLPDAALVALRTQRNVRADVLLTYLVNPWTAFYLGYTDGYRDFSSVPVTERPGAAGGWTSTGRQIFVKVSYLLRY
jgi:hypothetical protein